VSLDAVAVDAGGNLYVQSGSYICEISVYSLETIVYSGLSTPSGLAVDGLGNVYSADASKTCITQIVRYNLTCNLSAETTAGSGTETITAQNERAQTGSGNDYLSGYVCNACTLMS
jgi:hypothetical protein